MVSKFTINMVLEAVRMANGTFGSEGWNAQPTQFTAFSSDCRKQMKCVTLQNIGTYLVFGETRYIHATRRSVSHEHIGTSSAARKDATAPLAYHGLHISFQFFV